MEQERRLPADFVEFARSVQILQATRAEPSRLRNDVLELTHILGKAGRRRLRLRGS